MKKSRNARSTIPSKTSGPTSSFFLEETIAMKPDAAFALTRMEWRSRIFSLDMKRRTMWLIPAILFAVTLFLTNSASAQTTTSTIEGTVKDANGALIAGAQVKASSTTLAVERTVVTNAEGFYRLVTLPAGEYTVTVTQSGFAESSTKVEITVNRVVTLNFGLQVGQAGANVTVTDETPLLETNSSSTGTTVTPKQIEELPTNGRDYLDLLQIVPGVVIDRRSPGSDNANPVLGERSGNNNFLIDGQPNKDTVNGGPGSQFNQESIAEFQVLTTGYKAEFGQASGAIVNVITKSGGNQFHGVGSFFYRNDAFDSSNSLTAGADAPPLTRYDYSFALGGPIIKDKVFFFGSSERIQEDRGIDFTYPDLGTSPGAIQVENILFAQEDPLDGPQLTRETRNFIKFNQTLGRHQLIQELNYTNAHITGSGQSLPSARQRSFDRRLMFAAGDTMLLGEQGNPWIVDIRGAYRGDPSNQGPNQPQFPGGTLFNPFSVQNCTGCTIFGDLPTASFGAVFSESSQDQEYISASANASRLFGKHELKFGWNFLKTKVDGVDAVGRQVQLFSTVNDYATFPPNESGVYLLAATGGLTPEAREIHLDNNYNGIFFQDDWKILPNLTLNLGIRWDHDSEFSDNSNFSPRIGIAWSVDQKTVIRAHYGKFYDQFRLGLVSLVPAFGGADRRIFQDVYYPRGFYGSPSLVSSVAFLFGLPGPCISNTLTDAQINGALCPLAPPSANIPYVGVDRLNRVVAPNHAVIPANAVINISNIQQLSGLTPQQWIDAASAAIGQPAGYLEWGLDGYLRADLIPPNIAATTVDSTFKTPFTHSFSVGVQREITKDLVFEADYYHREMKNLLGIRYSNLAFRSRVTGRSFDPPQTSGAISTYGPFFRGQYDAIILSLTKRFSNNYQFGVSYTGASAKDNSLGIATPPSDSFVGVVPVVTEAATGRSNANGPFTTQGNRYVHQAGTFLNGPDRDWGPSSLSRDHLFQAYGVYEFPWQIQVSGIFRAQSGFRFSRAPFAGFAGDNAGDPDGDGQFRGIDLSGAGRNGYTSAPFYNLDMRFSKRFRIGEQVTVEALFEFFNIFNRQNPSAVQSAQNITGQPVGMTTQVLPGREGQLGFRVSF